MTLTLLDNRRAPRPAHDETRPPVSHLAGHTLLLITALAAALANQGGYYAGGQLPVALLLGLAVVTALRARPWSRSDFRLPPIALCVALAGWALLRATAAGDATAALPIVALLAGSVGVVAVARRAIHTDALASAAVALGALLAATGWIGVAWRVSPWALEDQQLWRAATSLTYANAAAGLLAGLLLLALGRVAGRRPAWPERNGGPSAVEGAALCLLVVGLGATLSRGGFLAAAVGLLILVRLRGFRATAAAGAAPFFGAAIALAGLLPSIPAASPPRPLLAVLALAAGLAVAAGLPRVSAFTTRRSLVVALAGLLAAVGVALAAGPALSSVGRTRFALSSPDRAREASAAMRLAADNPVGGVGPGQAQLRWTDSDGRTLVAKYVHNEYLQVLAELGAVGLVLVLALFIVSARRIRAARRDTTSLPLRAGAIAGLVALLVASGFDFLWHVPAIPLFGALLLAVTVPNNEKKGEDT